ncbi:hypothetical protein N7474_006558 [Penicillium riverlandense]|uniref:uncharacterized protein n=1 Tax=Penicillium riverlandense TaxID=1903569 RepID=UPI00254691D3|nr:uncharacterized protein N7474_006558 [Penicillium riverlandense]KAJ5814781.1 hypothetical protein N7474_006558 [Penicillium riverlandense]
MEKLVHSQEASNLGTAKITRPQSSERQSGSVKIRKLKTRDAECRSRQSKGPPTQSDSRRQ